MEGIIFDIQRNSLNDGPGIRTAIFLKGCSLNCLWCHNSESVNTRPMLRFFPDKCQHCLDCVKGCKVNGHINLEGKHKVQFENCVQNWDCIAVCPSEALVRTGNKMKIEEVLEIALKDQAYYKNSGGGVTLSGGEPMVQFTFTKAILKAFKQNKLHTCLDTTGDAPFKNYEDVLPYTDLFLYDYKETDPERHIEYTGIDNKRILANLYKLNKKGAKIILRCPVVPDLNDREDHFEAISALSRSYENIIAIHLLPYHTMGLGKAEQHGMSYPQKEFRVPDDAEKNNWKLRLNKFGAKNITIF